MPSIITLKVPENMNPKLVQIVPAEIRAKEITRIFQVTLKVFYTIESQAGIQHRFDYPVFEFCPDVFDAKWRVCGRIKESTHYFSC